jgi:DNA adenine methylase
MKYMDSKNRIAKHILPIMLSAANERGIITWVEPFVGGANMIDKVPSSFTRFGVDLNPHKIAALIAIRDMVSDLPDSLTETEYKNLKGTPPSPTSSWLRFVASFGGKFENGYARENGSNEKTFVGYGKRNAQKQSPNIQGVDFICSSYEELSPVNCLIYCDPPYRGTTGYKTGNFDHDKFWDWCREVSKRNVVFISEYNAPEDFTCIWQGELKTNFASDRKEATHKAVENLFTLKEKA